MPEKNAKIYAKLNAKIEYQIKYQNNISDKMPV